MKSVSTRTTFAALVQRSQAKVASALLVPVVAVMSSPAYAALPISSPTSGTDMQGNTVATGDWLGSMSAWFKTGISILGLVLLGLGFMYVVGGALSKWKAYSQGKAEIADLKEYFIMGTVLVVFLVMMMTYAFTTIGA